MDPAEPTRLILTIGFVPGVAPGKWFGRWRDRRPDIPLASFQVPVQDQTAILRDGRADMSFVRLPIDREGLSVIPLYRERPVVVAPRDHEIAVFDEVSLADLDGENLLDPEEMGGAETGVEVVASGAGLMILPMSLARLYSRRDVVYRPVSDGEETQVALAWPEQATDDVIEEFIGIVRGRTERSSRQPGSRQPGSSQPESGQAGSAKSAGAKQTGSKQSAARQTGRKTSGSRGGTKRAGSTKHTGRRGRR